MSRVARNTLFNLAGEAAPLVAALIAVPVLLHGIGVDRFGLLGIAWMLIGYASLFDFGIGRALTRVVSERIGTGNDSEIPTIVWTSMLMMFALGVVGAVAIVVLSPWLVHSVKMPEALRPEALRAFQILALSLPVVIVGIGLRGMLEALHRFDMSNAVRIPAGVFAFAGPLMVLPYTDSLVAVVAVLTLGRVASCMAYWVLCLKALPSLRQPVAPHLASIRQLFTVGSWMTVSNIVSPLMTVFDRFLIGALISTEAVAYYTTPYDLISKMLVLSGALAGVLFPTFAAEMLGDRARTIRLFRRAVTYVFLVLFPLTLVVVALAPEALTLWIGADVARHSAPVLKILAVAILINAMALVPFTLIQAAGRPDITAKLHLAELPLYGVAILLLTKRYGIVGAAVASGARMAFDAILLFIISRRILRFPVPGRLLLAVSAAAAAGLATFAFFSASFVVKSVALAAALILFLFLSLTWLITPEDRAMVLRWRQGLLGWTNP